MTYSSSLLSLELLIVTTIHFDVGVFDLSATESNGTNSFASGKYAAMFPLGIS